MPDAMAIVWKEWREQFGGRGLRGKTGILLTVVVFGVVMPLQLGRAWTESPALLLVWSWVPMFMVSTVIADAVAGERERHTLETLLASPLSDRAIVFGKMAAAVGYAGGVTLASVVLSAITVAIARGRPASVLSSLPVTAVILGFGLAAAVLVAAIGTLISLRAATVRQATQLLNGAIMAVVLGPVVLLRALPPSIKASLAANPAWLATLPIVALFALVALDAGAVALLVARFQRSRLVAG